ncbi:MAG: hypothetical protein ABIK09_11785 [Pseudomonadota bacterium]
MRLFCCLCVLLVSSWACTGTDGPPPDRTWLRGATLDAAPGRDFLAKPATTPYWEIERRGDALLVSNTSLGSGVTPVLYARSSPARLAWEVRAELLRKGIEGGWGVEFAYKDGEAYRALIYASGRFCVDRAFGEYPEFIHCVTRLPAIRIGEEENTLGLEVDGPHVRVLVNGRLALEFDDERLQPGSLALAVAGAGAKVLFHHGELHDISRGAGGKH